MFAASNSPSVEATSLSALMASLDDELLIVSSAGVVIRTAVREIAAQGRDATGVRVMNLDERRYVAAVAPLDATMRMSPPDPTPLGCSIGWCNL